MFTRSKNSTKIKIDYFKIAGAILLLIGLVAVILAFGVDLLANHPSDFGEKQWLLTAFGLVCIAAGVLTLSSGFKNYSLNWQPTEKLISPGFQPVMLGAWFGLITGFGEVLII